MLLCGQHHLSVFKSHPFVGYFPGLCSNAESHSSVAKHINPGTFLFGNIIRKYREHEEKSHPTIHSYFKNYFDFGRRVFLWCLSSCLFVAGGQGVDAHGCSEMLCQGKGCKMGVRPSGWRKRKICLLEPLISLLPLSLQLVSSVPVCVGANKGPAEVQIQQDLHSPEATGMVVERSPMTLIL